MKIMLVYFQISLMMAALSMAWIYLATYLGEKIGNEIKWPEFYKPKNQLGMYIVCVIIWPIVISIAILLAIVTMLSILKKL